MRLCQPLLAAIMLAGAALPLPAMGQPAAATAPAPAQPPPPAPVDYALSFDNAVHHEARVTATFRDVPAGPLTVRMARSSPGRYAVHEFAKNVYSLSARDGTGRMVPVNRTDPYSWIIPIHDGTVTVTYTVFADRADGTYSQIDASHAHLNMPATMLWAQGFEQRPVTVRFKPFDPSWTVATQLQRTADRNVFTAPNFQYLMDSPAELAPLQVREWKVADREGSATIRLAVHHLGSAAEVDTLADKTKKVVAEQIAVFNDVPNFDFGTYTFLVDAVPWAAGDGMEHRNSTYVTSSQPLAASGFDQLGTISHEFFHAWNVERLRPADLEPFDFTKADPTNLLWFGEGFTTYYGELFVRRAGESSVDGFLGFLTGMLNGVIHSPGRKYGSPEDMSLRAPFIDAAVHVDRATPNVVTNYYPYGGTVAVALDLMLRQRGQSLDEYMRHMWVRNGVNQKPIITEDLQLGLAELTRDPRFAQLFFDSYVRSSALPDFAPLLASAGFTVRPRNPGAAWAGPATLGGQGNAVILTKETVPGTPLYAAGVERDDEIVSLGGVAIDGPADWAGALARYQPGNTAEIVYVQRGRDRRAELAFAADPAFDIVRNEAIGVPLTPAQQAFRDSWLNSKAANAPR